MPADREAHTFAISKVAARAAHTFETNARLAAAAVKARRRIVVLGDSHVNLLRHLPGFLPIHIGPVTLNRLGKPHEILNQLRSRRRPVLLLPPLKVGAQDVVLICAGEIDVRCHLSTQITVKHRKEQAVIDDLVDRLVARLSEVKISIGCDTGAIAVPPPVRAIEDEPADYPIRGALRDRVRWTNQLNRRLKAQLSAEGHIFVPLPAGLTARDGSLQEELTDGNVHLKRSLAGAVASQCVMAVGEPPSVS